MLTHRLVAVYNAIEPVQIAEFPEFDTVISYLQSLPCMPQDCLYIEWHTARGAVLIVREAA